jgi:hypothetical protein
MDRERSGPVVPIKAKELNMDQAKRTYRDAETDLKKKARDVDGTDLKDVVGNAGDETRKDLGNAGDETRKDLGNAGDDVRKAGTEPTSR